MNQSSAKEVSLLLQSWRIGDQTALDKLVPLVYDELHRIAHGYMHRERVGHTLQTTALVNEVYLRLVDAKEVEWQDRAHFFAICASLMRRILVDLARSRGYKKRGGDIQKVTLDSDLVIPSSPDPDLVKLDDALKALAEFDPRKAKVVELRFFGGLREKEIAEVLAVSTKTVKRDWGLAKVWLLCQLRDKGRDES